MTLPLHSRPRKRVARTIDSPLDPSRCNFPLFFSITHLSDSQVTRAVYPFALCLTLGLLATMWLRPGLAQELIQIAGRIRAQSPDRYSTAPTAAAPPPHDPFAQVPYDSVARPPMQPVPVSKPVSWPGTQVQPATGTEVPPANPSVQQQPSGVKTWDPSAPQTSTPTTPYGAAPPPAAPPSTAGPIGNLPPVQPVTGTAAPGGPPQGNPLPAAPNLDAQNLQIWPSPPKDIPDAEKAAKVGTEVVLVGDLKAIINYQLHANKVEMPKEQLEAGYRAAYRSFLKNLIDVKLIYNDAIHTIPKEALTGIEADINAGFNREYLPKLLESFEVKTVQELDQKLRERSSSLDFMRRYFFEQTIAGQWKLQKVKTKEEIPNSEVVGFYRSHLADYEFPAKARWQEMMVRFDRYADKATAWGAIAQLGTAVQQGADFAQVAKANSQGLTAQEGGVWDWTTKGSLAAQIIDEAIFSLPVGQLSQIIETDRGFHIIRVTERNEAGRQSFVDVQSEIKKKIKADKEQQQIDDYLGDLRKRTPVWTMFDKEPGGLDGIQEERRSVFE